MTPSCHFLFLLLPLCIICNGDEHLVVISLAKGGTSRPFKVGPLDHDHSVLSPLQPQSLNAPPPENQTEVTRSTEAQGKNQKRDKENEEIVKEMDNTTENSVTAKAADYEETNITQSDASDITKPTAVTTQSTSTSSSTKISTSTSTAKPMVKTSSTTPGQPQTSQGSTSPLPQLHPCHQSCLEALNSTYLIPNDNVILNAGSSLTLECQMPLVPDLILEELLWLFHPGGSVEGRCSLTRNKRLHSCPGFPALSETDYNNGTFLKQILTLSGLRANHTGDYMCQVKVTCCSGSEQHQMSQQRETQVNVTVWWADYSIQLAATGVVAAMLLLGLMGVSVYGWRKGSKEYHSQLLAEVESQGILHLPLIDDQDTDSFDSSIMDEHD